MDERGVSSGGGISQRPLTGGKMRKAYVLLERVSSEQQDLVVKRSCREPLACNSRENER